MIPPIIPNDTVLIKELAPQLPVPGGPPLTRQPAEDMNPVLAQLIAAREEAQPKQAPAAADGLPDHAGERPDVRREPHPTRREVRLGQRLAQRRVAVGPLRAGGGRHVRPVKVGQEDGALGERDLLGAAAEERRCDAVGWYARALCGRRMSAVDALYRLLVCLPKAIVQFRPRECEYVVVGSEA